MVVCTFPDNFSRNSCICINVETYPAAIIWSNGASKSMKQYYDTASAPLGHGPRKSNEERYLRLQNIRCLQIILHFLLDELHWILVRNVPLLQYVLCPSRYRHFYWSLLRTEESSPAKCLSSAVNCQTKERILNHVNFPIYGLAKLEESLTHQKLPKAFKFVSQSQPHKVEVSLPRFKLTQQFQGQRGSMCLMLFIRHLWKLMRKALRLLLQQVWLWWPKWHWWWIPSLLLITHFFLWFAIRSQMQFCSWAACWSHHQALS